MADLRKFLQLSSLSSLRSHSWLTAYGVWRTVFVEFQMRRSDRKGEARRFCADIFPIFPTGSRHTLSSHPSRFCSSPLLRAGRRSEITSAEPAGDAPLLGAGYWPGSTVALHRWG